MRSCSAVWAQATWAFVRAAVPLLKQAVGGKLEQSSQQVAPQLCAALARLCAQSTQGGRAFAAHIFKECTQLPPAWTPTPPLACPLGHRHPCMPALQARAHPFVHALCWQGVFSKQEGEFDA